jgi:hypothetical protein
MIANISIHCSSSNATLMEILVVLVVEIDNLFLKFQWNKKNLE